jgi:sRNA-binding regulator protein Hfq
MAEKLGQEPAFPIEEMQKNVNDSGVSQMVPHLGMSKRFYAACMAMQGLLANSDDACVSLDEKEVARLSYKHADELLRQELE